jgi:hypothetical protein
VGGRIGAGRTENNVLAVGMGAGIALRRKSSSVRELRQSRGLAGAISDKNKRPDTPTIGTVCADNMLSGRARAGKYEPLPPELGVCKHFHARTECSALFRFGRIGKRAGAERAGIDFGAGEGQE